MFHYIIESKASQLKSCGSHNLVAGARLLAALAILLRGQERKLGNNLTNFCRHITIK